MGVEAAIAAFVSKDLDHPVKFTGIPEAVKENEWIKTPVVGDQLEEKKIFPRIYCIISI
ncbi:hypothetical protein [Paenibacillus polymyxa]|uniref:hypothetical protein n=1 Tax=Paenibacillus polymyxa TaxID=1406 RepID=UPI00287FD2DB|nr:hypothetical protein [Paenibacillus polymyxa]